MALQKQKIPLELTTGMDTKSDEFNSVSFRNVLNYRYNNPGALNKVPGYSLYNNSLLNLNASMPTITDASAIYSLNNQLILNTSKQLLVYDKTYQKWISKNYKNVNSTNYSSDIDSSGVTYVETSEHELFADLNVYNEPTITRHDFFVNTDYIVGTASDPTDAYVRVTVMRKESKTKILDSFLPEVGVSPPNRMTNRKTRIAGIYNNRVYICSWISNAVNLILFSYDLLNPNAAPTIYTTPFGDFVVAELEVATGIIYLAGSNGPVLNMGKFDISTSSFTYVVSTLTQVIGVLYMDILNSGLSISGFNSGQVWNVTVSKTTLLITTSLLAIEVAVNWTTANDGTNTYFITSYTNGTVAGAAAITAIDATHTTNVLGGQIIVSGACQITGKAVYNNGVIYFNAFEGSIILRNYLKPEILVSMSNATMYTCKINLSLLTVGYHFNAEIIAQSGYYETISSFNTVRMFLVDGALYATTELVQTFYNIVDNQPEDSRKEKIIFAKHELMATKTKETYTDSYLIIPSSVPRYFDGENLVEAGFTTSPDLLGTITKGVSSFYPFAAGKYGIALVYTWKDNDGRKHVSPPYFTAFTANGTNDSDVNFYVRNITLTNKKDIYIEVYSTAANGEIYYKLPSKNDRTFKNNKYAQSTQIFISPNDAGITSNEILYTNGGVLESDMPLYGTASTNFKNRIFITNKNQINYSNITSDGLPIIFNRSNVISPTSPSGDLLAAAGMDNVLAVFTQDSIYILSGNGPNELGQQDDYGPLQKINSDVGLTDINSLVETPDGYMFKSEKGIYLLNRGLYVSYIGAQVEQYNGEKIVSAQLLNNTNEVRYVTAEHILSYDYFTKQWSVFDNVDNDMVDSVISDNQFHYVRANGNVLKNDDSLFTNNGAFYGGKLETNWITVAGLNSAGQLARAQQGFQRLYTIYILGRYKSAHTLNVSVAYNYDETVVDTAAITAVSGTYQWVVKPSRQKCESFKLIIEDVNQSGTGESLVLANLLLEVGIKGSPQKVTGDGSSAPTT